VNCQQTLAVEMHAVRCQRRIELYRARHHVDFACHQTAVLHRTAQIGNAALLRQRLQHQLDRAAARQAEAMRFFRRDAVLHRLRACLFDTLLPHAVDQIVFDAATRYRTHYESIVTHREHRALGTRRRAPRLHHRHQ
jgi:hypothetical protein